MSAPPLYSLTLTPEQIAALVIALDARMAELVARNQHRDAWDRRQILLVRELLGRLNRLGPEDLTP
jgi:hypothetical protein